MQNIVKYKIFVSTIINKSMSIPMMNHISNHLKVILIFSIYSLSLLCIDYSHYKHALSSNYNLGPDRMLLSTLGNKDIQQTTFMENKEEWEQYKKQEIERRLEYINKTSQQRYRLTPEQTQALIDYTQDDYQAMNKDLRSEQVNGDVHLISDPKIKEKAKLVYETLIQLRAMQQWNPGSVGRKPGQPFNKLYRFQWIRCSTLSMLKNGTEIMFNQFTSATLELQIIIRFGNALYNPPKDIGPVSRVLFIIEGDHNHVQQGALIREFSLWVKNDAYYQNEEEVLFPPKATFIITRINWNEHDKEWEIYLQQDLIFSFNGIELNRDYPQKSNREFDCHEFDTSK